MLTGELKGLLSIKIKSRHDGLTDQFCRIFVVKMLLVVSMLMGLSWFKDSISCIVPGSAGISGGFVSDSCWIQGVYVYDELRDNVDDTAYYGLPRSIDFSGRNKHGHLCTPARPGEKVNVRTDPTCKEMTKIFYLQYQWMPFFVAALAFCFYVPYLFFRMVNNDMISLKNTVKTGDADADKIVHTYFNHKLMPTRVMRFRVAFNLLIKLAYIIVNVVAFVGTDHILNGKFSDYGSRWMKWAKLNNTLAHDYMGARNFPKPGNELLPPFGYCELWESWKDVQFARNNKHKFVCELSQNILYQYCLLVVWFLFVLGITVSCIGLVVQICDHLITVFCILRTGTTARKMYEVLTLRECEYLEFIRRRNIPLYSDVMQMLKQEKFGGRNPGAPLMNGTAKYNGAPPPVFRDTKRDIMADTNI